MTLENISLLLFIKYMRQFKSIKIHMAASLRELLFAVSSTFEIINLITQDNLLLKNSSLLKNSLYKIDHLLSYTIKQLDTAPHPEESGPRLNQQIINSLLEAIDDEIENLTETKPENFSLKIEALNTVKSVVAQFYQKQPCFSDFDEMTPFERAVNQG